MEASLNGVGYVWWGSLSVVRGVLFARIWEYLANCDWISMESKGNLN